MAVKHRIKCDGSEVMVREEEGSYILSIQASSNPLGFGSLLEAFPNQDEAVRAAEKFCMMLAVAKERGYYLENGYFVKPEKERIPVNVCLQQDELTEESWIIRLERV
ncbi:hypothetical protein [Paenibacillus validus]|uniref:Uncharacterized protein n=1 Tax=Paenibacillus validus TaxID=44253 RepID=A0A7X2ZF59_9BACL|nr:hypothetical protein [Paenibacillus validus]MUG73190.1 hypothetical protein [Paenibacillus validus]